MLEDLVCSSSASLNIVLAVQPSPTLQILRTPMPFGSPVPYPQSHGKEPPGADLGLLTEQERDQQMSQAEQRGIPSLPYSLPYELR